jgi:hypothetical protein
MGSTTDTNLKIGIFYVLEHFDASVSLLPIKDKLTCIPNLFFLTSIECMHTALLCTTSVSKCTMFEKAKLAF